MARGPGWILLMPSLMAILHLSHLVGLASLHYCTERAMQLGRRGWPMANGATSLVDSCWLTPKFMGTTEPVSGCGKYNTSTMCVCVCMHAY